MRYKKQTREDIDKALHDAIIANLSEKETIQYVLEQTGITISHFQVVERKRILRNRGIAKWNNFRKDDYAYRLEHLQRMNEAKLIVEQSAKKVMEFYNNPKTFFQWKAAAYTLLDASKYLHELDKLIPEIDTVTLNAEMDQSISQIQSEEHGQVLPQKGRVF